MTKAIIVDRLTKRYSLGDQGGYRMLRDSIATSFNGSLRRVQRVFGGRKELAEVPSNHGDFWALRDVSFDVDHGQVIGVIGRNGAGKSTLLKILTRITRPTSGRARINGRVASLLEVGTGFHPELTGRENIYLNGAILGMRRTEIDRKFDAIVAFAEVDEFLDTPVKRYSSGMYVRLAFAVAAHLEPEILLVDEVLAVGDVAFQRKCLGKMGEVAQSGRTVILVSHNMAAVARRCTRAVWLDKGQLHMEGDADQVIAAYLASGTNGIGELTFSEDLNQRPGTEYIRLGAVRVRSHKGTVTNTLDLRFPFSVEMEYRILRPAANLRLGLRIIANDGTVIFSTRDLDDGNEVQVRNPGDYISRCSIPGNFLDYGDYFVSFGADVPKSRNHFALDQALAFRIEPTGGAGGHVADGRSGLLRIQLPWEIEPLSATQPHRN